MPAWTDRYRPIAAAALTMVACAVSTADARDHKACDDEIGRNSAERLKRACRDVSPATHPPCGTSNSCALIKDEIARGCTILGDAEAAKIRACDPAPTSAAAAVSTLRRYYEAIDEHDYETAYALLKPDGGRTQSPEDFRNGFAKTRVTRIEPGAPGSIEGAAGSVYVTIPVTIKATLKDGTSQRLAGSYVLRRVTVATRFPSDDARWHVFSSDLHPQARP